MYDLNAAGFIEDPPKEHPFGKQQSQGEPTVFFAKTKSKQEIPLGDRINKRKEETERQKLLIFLMMCFSVFAAISTAGVLLKAEPPTLAEGSSELIAELDANKALLESLVITDFKPNVTSSNSVGEMQKLWLNMGSKERSKAKDRLSKSGDICNTSNQTITTCLYQMQAESIQPLIWRIAAGEKFVLVSLDKPLKLTKDKKLNPSSAETPAYPELAMFTALGWLMGNNQANYETAYDFEFGLASLETLQGDLAAARTTRLASENRVDAATRLKQINNWTAKQLEEFRKEQALKKPQK